ncbi:MAG: hypothetical protein LH474_13085 [Chamaesiphon sp.]|nr:hypothetical protein [Chamaesiphon sp.]
MNAQHSFEPQEQPIQRRRSAASQQLDLFQSKTGLSPRKRSRAKVNPVYAHRRQGLEAGMKLVTYSALSVFGIVTLVNSIGYNWAQHGKLQHLKTEVQDAKIRTEKINHNFSRSFDPQAQTSLMEDNSYKIAPNRRQIVLIEHQVNSAGKVISK